MIDYVNRRVFKLIEAHFKVGEQFTVWDIMGKTARNTRFPSSHQVTKVLTTCDRVQVVGQRSDARGAVNVYERLS